MSERDGRARKGLALPPPVDPPQSHSLAVHTKVRSHNVNQDCGDHTA